MSEAQKVEVTIKKEKGKNKDDEEKDEVERLKAELETERIEKEDALNKLTIIGQKAFERRKKELECRDDEIDSPEKLKAWASGAGKKSKGNGSGVLELVMDPNTGRQVQQGDQSNFLKKKYEGDSEGFKKMLDELHEKARDSDNLEESAMAQAVLDELLRKTVKGVKEGKKTSGDVPMKLDMKKYNKERKKQNE